MGCYTSNLPIRLYSVEGLHLVRELINPEALLLFVQVEGSGSGRSLNVRNRRARSSADFLSPGATRLSYFSAAMSVSFFCTPALTSSLPTVLRICSSRFLRAFSISFLAISLTSFQSSENDLFRNYAETLTTTTRKTPMRNVVRLNRNSKLSRSLFDCS
jgi:hypothetical protein